ncbi:MAG TPA: hypothetical protein VH988_12985 [Thermoanaerobaculia bacterium]|jgi:hypothetical protein|nr:hypothetical protein [Thermoanaerobaculia bacterium]
MADIKILASPDFAEQTAEVVPLLDSLMLGVRGKETEQGEKIDLKESLDSVTLQTEEEVRSLLGAAGWGIVGSLLLGALWGGRGQKEICFEAQLKDGRKFLGISDAPTFQKLKAVTIH